MNWFTAVLDSIRRELRSYDGLRTFVLLASVLCLSFVTYTMTKRGLADPALFFDSRYSQFAIAYWKTHSGVLAVLLLMLLIASTFDIGAKTYHRFFRAMPLRERNRRQRRIRRFLRGLMLAINIYLFFMLLPLLHLRYPEWTVWLLAIFPIPLAVLGYAAFFRFELTERQEQRSLATLSYPTKNWNVAAIGAEPREAEIDLIHYRTARKDGYMSEAAILFVTAGDSACGWSGNGTFIDNLGKLLGVAARDIRLFDRTTDALRHALSEAKNYHIARVDLQSQATLFGRKLPKVVTTDSEYESIATMLGELHEQHEIQLVKVLVAKAIWTGASREAIVASVTESIADSADIVCMSHVACDSGFEFPLEAIIESVTKKRPGGRRPIWIIDGAQALGNSIVSANLLQSIDYYGACGHKWLGGRPSLGILYSNSQLEDIDRIPNTRSLSSTEDRTLAGTVDITAHISLNTSLNDFLAAGIQEIAEHNRALAKTLARLVSSDGILTPVLAEPFNGIVTLEGPDASKLHRGLRRQKISSTFYPERSAIRLCCHYFHSEGDVYELIHQMLRVLE